MADKLHRIYEYRALRARREDLAITLLPEEEERLTRLDEQLKGGVPQLNPHDPYTLIAEPWSVQIILAGRFIEGLVENASGAGFAITCAELPALGERVVLQLASAQHGSEYGFPGTVVWRVLRGSPSVGIGFDGTPTKTPIGRFSGVYAKDEPAAEPAESGESKRHSA